MKLTKTSYAIYAWLLTYFILVGLILNNTVPYETDESFYITSSINMVKSHNYLLPTYFGDIRFQKPILPYWIVVLSYKLFGIHLWSSRILFLVIACLTLFTLYKFALLIIPHQEFAILTVLLLSSSSIFIEYSRLAMTDLVLTFFTTLSLYYFYKTLVQPEGLKINYFLGYITMGLAFLSKGFVGIFPLFAMLFYLIYLKPENYKKYLIYLIHPINLLAFMLIAFPWYLYAYTYHYRELFEQIKTESSAVSLLSNLESMIENMAYYFRVIVYYLPVTVVAAYVYLKKRTVFPKEFTLFLPYICAVLVVFIFFVERHRARYLLVLFPLLAILSAYLFYKNGLASTLKKVTIGLFCLHLTLFLLYSYFSGEPIKKLVLYWKNLQQGDLAVYGLDRYTTSWAQAFSEGRLKEYDKDVEYIILLKKDLDTFKNYEILQQAKLLRKIKFKNYRPIKDEREYVLIKRTSG